MSSFDHALGLWNGVFRSNVLPWFCKAAVHSEHIRGASRGAGGSQYSSRLGRRHLDRRD